MKTRVKINKGWSSDIERELNIGLLDMTTDIHRRSAILAPKDTRALVNSGMILPVHNGYEIKYGSPRVPYARIRHFENRKNPQTIGYLIKAGESVVRGDVGKYFRSLI